MERLELETNAVFIFTQMWLRYGQLKLDLREMFFIRKIHVLIVVSYITKF